LTGYTTGAAYMTMLCNSKGTKVSR